MGFVMTKEPITVTEAGRKGGKVGGKSRSEAKLAALAENAKDGGPTPKGYRIVKTDGRWVVWSLGADGLIASPVGTVHGYERRRDAMQAAREDKKRRTKNEGGDLGHSQPRPGA